MPGSKQSLVDFQQHIMKRLSSVRAVSDVANWLGVEAGGGRYLLPLSEAGEVFQHSAVPALEPVPHTKFWFLGVANLRGVPTGVTDLAGWLGLRTSRVDLGSRMLEDSSLIAFSPALDVNGAVFVDRLAGLRTRAMFTPVPADSAGPAGLESYTDAAGLVWKVLSLEALAASDSFLDIAA